MTSQSGLKPIVIQITTSSLLVLNLINIAPFKTGTFSKCNLSLDGVIEKSRLHQQLIWCNFSNLEKFYLKQQCLYNSLALF